MNELSTESILWVAAIDRVPIEERVVWVASMKKEVDEINLKRGGGTMASIIIVKVKYSDNSKSLTEEYTCADTHPSADIIKDCETQTLDKWAILGGTWRDLQTHSTVRLVK